VSNKVHWLWFDCVPVMFAVLSLQMCVRSVTMSIIIAHYIISNTFYWTRAVGYIGTYPTVLYFLSKITSGYFPIVTHMHSSRIIKSEHIIADDICTQNIPLGCSFIHRLHLG